MRKLFIYDLETTGLDHSKHGIHQLSFLIVIDNVIKHEANLLIKPNPNIVIEDEALAIGNVTREMLQSYEPAYQNYNMLLQELSKYVDKYDKKDKFHLVGYNNSSFDNQFLRAFFAQNNDKYFGSWFWSDTIDVMCLASNHFADVRHRMENFKLATVAKQFDIQLEESKLHDATYDLYLTKEIYDIINIGRVIHAY